MKGRVMKKSFLAVLLLVLALALTGCGEDYDGLMEKGAEYKAGGKIDEAIETFEKAKETDPGRPEAYIELYKIYGKNREYDKALAISEEGAKNIKDSKENTQFNNRVKTLKDSYLDEDLFNYNNLYTAASVAITGADVYTKATAGKYTMVMGGKGVTVKYNDTEVGAEDPFYKGINDAIPGFAADIKKIVVGGSDYVITVEGGVCKKTVSP